MTAFKDNEKVRETYISYFQSELDLLGGELKFEDYFALNSRNKKYYVDIKEGVVLPSKQAAIINEKMEWVNSEDTSLVHVQAKHKKNLRSLRQTEK